MKNCPMCFSEVPDDSPAFVALELERQLQRRWDSAESDSGYYGWPIGNKIQLEDGQTAEVVAKKVRFDPTQGDTGESYSGGSELSQGTTFMTYVILKVGEHYYRKTGEGDSYSDITWAGPVYPVVPREKTVTVYDFA